MKRIFITGASGCIGHYIVEALIEQTNHELFLLVRNPDKLKFDYNTRSGIHILEGDLQNIEKFRELLFQEINIAILIATSWGGKAEAYDINVVKTIALLEMLNPNICEQVLYFSTASILDRNNQLLPQAEQFGTDYIRTKYQCFSQLSNLNIANKIVALFPTLVFGGDKDKPVSHLSSGLPEIVKWLDLIRWLKAEGSFHFIHAKDIAQVVCYLVDNYEQISKNEEDKERVKKIVLGNKSMTVNEAIEEICKYFNKETYLRFALSWWLTDLLIKIFRIQMDSWSYFSLKYRHFVYQNPIAPSNFGLTNYCSNLATLMKISGFENNK
jgi:nucleoside-diphosphate-sugar epimerase